MVGLKINFHVAGGPKVFHHFVTGLGEAIGAYVNRNRCIRQWFILINIRFISEEGGKEPLQTVLGQFHMGSDHEVYEEGSFKFPVFIYMTGLIDTYMY